MQSVRGLSGSLLLLFFFYGTLNAQRPSGGQMPSIGRVYGKVLEANSRKGVEFATVTVLAAGKDSILGGSLVRANGDFSIDKLPLGNHRLRVSFIGYKTIEQPISISMTKYEIDLGNLRLAIDAAQLATRRNQ
jgi:hypothetical protein